MKCQAEFGRDPSRLFVCSLYPSTSRRKRRVWIGADASAVRSRCVSHSPVRRSPRISMSHLTSSHSNLDPEILASPTFSQNELSMLLNALSDGGPTPTRSGGLAATVAAAEAASPRRSPRVKAPML